MNTFVQRAPPGPAGSYEVSEDLLRWLKAGFDRHGDFYQASVYGANAFVVSNPQAASHVLRAHWRNYKKGQDNKRIRMLLGNGLMVSDSEFWKNQRKMIQPAFCRESIDRLAPIVVSANGILLKKWQLAAERNECVNVSRDVSLLVLNVVLIALFGNDYEEVAPHFRILSQETERSLQFAQAFRALAEIVIKLVARRRAHNVISNDMLGQLMEARDRQTKEGMPDRQLASEVLTIIVAGHETTATTLAWVWYLLSQNENVEQALSSELAALTGDDPPHPRDLQRFVYASRVIDEALRLYPPGWLMTRKALADDQLAGYCVAAGTEVYISPYLIHRHPGLWDDPDRFDPDRFQAERSSCRHEFAMLPFSAGPRNCIGEYFARVEMQTHLVMIAKSLRLRYLEAKPLDLNPGINLRNKHDFIMKPEAKSTG
jgi:enediyne biosynthesis protein E7